MANHSKKTKKLDLLKQQLRTSEDKLPILHSIAQQYIKHNDLGKALKYLNEALLQQEHPITYSLLAYVYSKLSDTSTAISHYKKAIAVLGSAPIAQEEILKISFELGQAYQQIGHHYDAFYCYESVLKIDYTHSQAFQLNLGIVGSIVKLLTEAWYVLVDTSSIPYPPVTNEIPERCFELNVSLPSNLSEYSDAEKDNFCLVFNQELGNALCRVKSMPELESFLSIFLTKEIQQLSYSHPQYFRAYGENWCIALKNILSTKPCKLTLRLFELPVLLSGWNWKSEKGHFTSERMVFKRLFNDSDTIPIIRCNARILLFCFDAIEDSMQAALSAFVKDWMQNFTDQLCLAMTAPLWSSLFASGWFNDIDDKNLIISLMSHYANCLNSQNEKYSHITWFLLKDLLRYSLHSEREWNRHVFEYLVIPIIKKSIQNKKHGLALSVAKLTSFSYAQQPHTDEQTELCWRTYLDDFLQAGREIARNLTPLTVQPQPTLNIGIIIDSIFNNCSPITVLFETFKDISKLAHPITITIYAYNSIPEDCKFLVEKFQRIGVEVVDVTKLRDGLCPELDSASERILMLRKLMTKHAIQMAIYTHSTPAFIAFAATIGLAPIQVSMSMGGYYTLRIPEVQEYIIGVFLEEENRVRCFAGMPWRTYSFRSSQAFKVNRSQEYIERAHFIRNTELKKYTTVIGCICRPEKIDNNDFLNTLAILLKSNPSTVFLWFGQMELISLKQRMEKRGILEQCIFRGHVDVNVYARVIDIHIDSFPFPTGLSALQCMSAGTACVHYFSQEHIETIPRYISFILNNQMSTSHDEKSLLKNIFVPDQLQSLFLGTSNKDEYVELIQMLINDLTFRAKVGAAGFSFMEAFMSDSITTADSFASMLHTTYNNKYLLQ